MAIPPHEKGLDRAHEIGVHRHGKDWINANEAAVSALAGTDLKPWDPKVKKNLPLAILRVLDRLKITAGLKWDEEQERWI